MLGDILALQILPLLSGTEVKKTNRQNHLNFNKSYKGSKGRTGKEKVRGREGDSLGVE